MARTSARRALEIVFGMDTKQVSSGFRQVSMETGRFSRAAATGTRSTDRLRGALAGAAMAAGGAAAAYLSVSQARAAIETTQELALATMGLERNLGLATKEASRWAAVTRARGIDSKALTMGFTSLSKAIESSKDGTESALRPFQALGITQRELSGTQGDFRKQVLLVADALGEAEGSAARQAAAQKLLGRGYTTILPMFSKGAAGLQEQLRWADEFGAVMGQDTVDAMDAFTTAQRRSRVAMMALQIAFARELTPAITEGLDYMGDLVATLNDPNLGRAEKLARLRAEFVRMSDAVLRVVSDLAPAIAQRAGEVGVILAKSIGRAFLETGLLGKVAISVFLIKMLGGPAAILAGGRTVGAMMSTGVSQGLLGASLAQGRAARDLSRSFGGSMTRNLAAGAGAFGLQIGTSLMAGLKRFLPGLAATFAIGDILASAIAGDTRSAMIKGGGAAIGAAIGAAFGPAGILVGAGLGTALAPLGARLVEGIIGGAKNNIPTLQETIARGAQDVARAVAADKTAITALVGAGEQLSQARDRQAQATQRVQGAERRLADARARFGPSSRQAIAAENELAVAKGRVAAANRRVQSSERLTGAVRDATKASLRATVAQQKLQLENLQQERREALRGVRALDLKKDSTEKIQATLRRYNKANAATKKGERDLSATLERAARQIGPKFVERLREMSSGQLRFGRSFIRLKTDVQIGSLNLERSFGLVGRSSQRQFGNATGAVGDFAKATGRRKREVNANMRAMPPVQEAATGRMVEDFWEKRDALNPGGRPKVSKRRGGSIPFLGGGRSVPAAVSPGEVISYRGRSMVVPGRPEPKDSVLMSLPVGAKVFTFDGQMLLAGGASESEALRRQAPHFAQGGVVKPTVTGGSRSARGLANRAVSKLGKVADRRLEAARERAAYRSYGGAFIGPPPSFKELGNNAWVDANTWTVAAWLADKFGLSISSNYRTPAHNAAVGGVPNSSHTRGSAANPGAFDFVPASSALQAFAGQRVAGITENMIHDVGSGLHNHIAFFRGGGKVLGRGPAGPIRSAPWLSKIKSWGPNMLATLAWYVGFPNPGLMSQIARGESSGDPFTVGDDAAAGYGNTFGYGLWQITSGYNDDLIRKYGGVSKSGIFNPLHNALAAKEILDRNGIGSWYAPPTGPAGKVDKDFLFKLMYSPKARKGARRSAGRTRGRVGDLWSTIRSGGGSPEARDLAKRARKNARTAVKLAGKGNVGGARKAARKAHSLTSQAVRALKAGNRDSDKETPPPKGGSSWMRDLPKPIRDLLRSPKLSLDEKLSILERGETLAEGTKSLADDRAVLRARLAIQKRARKQALGAAARANKILGQKRFSPAGLKSLRKLARDGSPEEKRKARRALARYGKAREARETALQDAATAESDISSTRASLAEKGSAGSGSEADLAQAMADLAAAIKEQNRLQQDVGAVSSREALRLLSDVISGEIVGKRAAVPAAPAGVRY